MTRLLVPVLAVVVLAGCAGMGGKSKAPPRKTLSHAQFVRCANRICSREKRETKALSKPTNFATLVRTLRLGTKAYERTVSGLRGLAPPPSDAASFQRLLRALDRADLLLHRVFTAVEARNARGAKALARKADAAGKRLDSLAARLGLTVCAKD